MMPKSSVYPSLERKMGGPDNWVEQVGGLPKYIERIAKHLHYERGYSIQRSIAIAVNTVKRWARKGTVVKYGDPNMKRVTTITASQAAAAVAEWEAKKARARALPGTPRGGRMGRSRSVKLSEDSLTLQALAARANAISDPELRAEARLKILDLARKQGLPKQQKCKYCDAAATKRIIHAEGMAYIPVCAAHLAKGKEAAMRVTPDGSRDPSNIDRVVDLARAMTKDGRPSFKNQGKWKHGFVPVDEAAVTSKAKGSPIAKRRIKRIYKPDGKAASDSGKVTGGRGSGATIKEGGEVSGRLGSVATKLRVGKPIGITPKHGGPGGKQVTGDPNATRAGRTSTVRKSWDQIPDGRKVVRNGKRYVLVSVQGKQQLAEWKGNTSTDQGKKGQTRIASIASWDADKLTKSQIKNLLDTKGKVASSARKPLNAALRAKLKQRKRT